MHNLDTCEVTVTGDELDREHESLELDVSQLQQRGLEMSSSNLGLVITGTHHRFMKMHTVKALVLILTLGFRPVKYEFINTSPLCV